MIETAINDIVLLVNNILEHITALTNNKYLISGLIGALSSLLVVAISEHSTRAKLEIIEDESTPDNAPDGSRSCYHIKVRNKNVICYLRWIFRIRKPAWKVKATIQVLNEQKEIIIERIYARWPSAPEPITPRGEVGGVRSTHFTKNMDVAQACKLTYAEVKPPEAEVQPQHDVLQEESPLNNQPQTSHPSNWKLRSPRACPRVLVFVENYGGPRFAKAPT